MITSYPDNADFTQNSETSKSELLVNLEGSDCEHNSTSTPLGIGGVFTGSEWVDT